MHPSAVFPRTATFDGARLGAIGGVDVDELVARHGTPLWVLDREELVARMRAWRDALRAAAGDDADVLYAAKALCVVGVLQLASAEGLGVDVASAGELRTAELAGVPPRRIVHHGNNKSLAELLRAVELGVGRVVVDSLGEIDRLAAVAHDAGAVVDVLVRITPGVHAETHAAVATGHDDSKFGFTLSRGLAHTAVARVRSRPTLRLRGVHCHIGSQIAAPGAFAAAVGEMTGFLADLRDTDGVEVAELNLGGGLGIAYRPGDPVLGIDEHVRGLVDAVDAALRDRSLARPRLQVEPGRSIAGPAGVTLYRVGTIKRIPAVRTFVAVDGGMSDNPRPALYGARYAVVPAGSPEGAGTATQDGELVTLVGKHCESGDVLAWDVELREGVAEGDLVAVAASGAYHHALASNYNRLPRPAMVLVGDGREDLLVRRETLDDVVGLDVPLAV